MSTAIEGVSGTGLEAQSSQIDAVKSLIRWESPHPLSIAGVLDAGVDGLPILDWFHVAMRLRHLTQVAGGLSSEGPERAAAKAAVVEEVERLRWRLWNGKAK